MTVWTLDQMRQAERLRRSLTIDDTSIMRLPPERLADLEAATFRKLARALTEYGATYGLDLHSDDMQIHVMDGDPARRTREIAIAWRPIVRTLDVVGGPHDGTTVEHPEAVGPIVLANPMTRAALAREEDPLTVLTPTSTTYHLAGWHSERRHWIYAPR